MISAEALHLIHARAFAGQGRAWSADEIAALLASPHVLATIGPHAFALTRVVAGEAELLTIATDPDHRRRGLGAGCLALAEAGAAGRGATRMVLEVAADNDAARGLYRSVGYGDTGRRKGYYRRPDGQRVDALTMAREL